MIAHRAFCFIHYVLGVQTEAGRTTAGTHNRATCEVPYGQSSCVILDDAGVPRIVPSHSAESANALLIEPVRNGHKLFLAAVVPPDLNVRQNGMPAPPVCVVQVGDQLEIDGRCVLHASIFVRPYLGPPKPERVGTSCPFCTTPICADRHVYECPICQIVMHADTKEVDEQERLECHLLASTCPACQHPIVLTEGFVYVPET